MLFWQSLFYVEFYKMPQLILFGLAGLYALTQTKDLVDEAGDTIEQTGNAISKTTASLVVVAGLYYFYKRGDL